MDPLVGLAPPDTIGLVFVNSSLYGAFLVLFFISSFILHRQATWTKGTGGTSGDFGTSVYLGLGYIVLILTTAAWILSWLIVLKPSLRATNSEEWSAHQYAQSAVGWFGMHFAEWILIYRLYIIWQRQKIILWIALIVTLGYLGMTIQECIIFARTNIPSRTGMIEIVITSICVTVIVNVLIIWKIWHRTRLSAALGGWRIFARIAAIMVESAALYTTWIALFLVLYVAKANSEESHIFLYGTPSVAGIAAMLVNIRVGLGWAVGEEGRKTRSLRNSAFSHQEDFDVEHSDFRRTTDTFGEEV